MEERIKRFLPWFTAGAILFLLIVLVIVSLLSYRGISTNRASTERIATEVDRLSEEMEQAGAEIDKLKAEMEKADAEGDRLREDLREDLTEDISANADRLQEETTKAKLQVLLLKASAKALSVSARTGSAPLKATRQLLRSRVFRCSGVILRTHRS